MSYEKLPATVKRWKAEGWNKYFNCNGYNKFSLEERSDIEDYFKEFVKPKLAPDQDEPMADMDIKTKEKDFIMVPDVLLTFHKEKGLNWFDILLYGKLKGLCNKHGYCWASNRSLSEFFDVSTRTVQYALETLTKNKFIKIKMNYRENTFHVQSRHITITPIKKQKRGKELPKIPEDELGISDTW